MDPDIRELQEKAKELRVASEQLEWQIQLFAAQSQLLEETRWLVMEGAELLCYSPVCVTRLYESVHPIPPFEDVRQLCKQIVACKTEAEAVELVPELKALVHDYVGKRLRGNEGKI